MNITDTITSVDPVPDQPKDSSYGPTWWIGGRFKSGASFSRGAKSADNAHKLHATLTALIGTEGTFEVKDKGEFRGAKNYGLDSWPGKEERPFMGGGGGGGKAPYQPRFRDTEEGFAREQRSIHRSVALQYAVALRDTAVDADGVLVMAQKLYTWLSQDTPPAAPAKDTMGEPRIGTAHPAMKEQVDFFGQRGPTAKELYVQEIGRADSPEKLQSLFRRITKSKEELKTITQSEEAELHKLLMEREESLKSF